MIRSLFALGTVLAIAASLAAAAAFRRRPRP